MKKGVHLVALLGVVRRLHRTAVSSEAHFPPNFLSLWNILGLIPLRDHSVGPFHLPISAWVTYYCPIHLNFILVTKMKEFLSGELKQYMMSVQKHIASTD